LSQLFIKRFEATRIAPSTDRLVCKDFLANTVLLGSQHRSPQSSAKVGALQRSATPLECWDLSELSGRRFSGGPSASSIIRRRSPQSSAGVGALQRVCRSFCLSGLLLMVVSPLSCAQPTSSQIAIIGSSSMEPTLQGPRVIGNCDNCERSFSLAEDIARRVSVLRCPHCNEPLATIDSLNRVPGQSVLIDRVNESTKLRRGAIIVFNDESLLLESQQYQKPRQIKRLVGFPGESIRISDGDLFVNGHRHQKSSDDFYRSAIHVSDWPEAVEFTRNPTDRSSHIAFQSTSLWPRTSAQSQRNPSPILDELPINAEEPFEFTPVHDIGLVFEFQSKTKVNAAMTIGIWSRGFMRSVDIQFGDHHCVATPSSNEKKNLRAMDCYVQQAGDLSENLNRILVAVVDARMLVACFDQKDRVVNSAEWDLHECLDLSDRFVDAQASAVRPIVISVRHETPQMNSVSVVHDTHYRGPRGEYDFALPVVNAMHVLGDNVSISNDSRSGLSSGIVRNRITGRVALMKQ
jgi:signal peptidase I